MNLEIRTIPNHCNESSDGLAQLDYINDTEASQIKGGQDPKALIQLQLLAFLFTNTVSSVSGSLQSVSSATQSAASKVGQ